MRAVIVNIILIPILFLLDFYYIDKAMNFSEIYPFNRVYMENSFVYKTDLSKDVVPRGSVIVKIENDPVDAKNFISILRKHGDKEVLSVTYSLKGVSWTKEIIKESINRGYYTYLLLILLFANVYFIWGLFVFMINPYQYQGKIYFICTTVISILYFQLCEIFIFRDYQILFVAAGLILGYLVVLLGYNIANQKMPRKLALLFIIVNILYFGFVSYQLYRYPYQPLPLISMLFYLVSCMVISAWKMISANRTAENPFLKRRNLIIIASVIISYIIPSIAVIISLFTGLSLPVPFILSFMLLTPLLVGNGILQSTYYGLMHFRYDTISIVIVNSLAVFAGAVLLGSFYFTADYTFYKSAHFYIVLLFFIFLFHFLFLFNRRNLNIGFRQKTEFAYSLQNIAELASSPEELRYKLKNIFSEIKNLTAVKDLKLVIFKNLIVDEYYINLDEFIEILPLNSDLARFLNVNKKPFMKYQLIESSTLREDVVKFLDKRDVILVLPVFKDRELLLALLIGEKKGAGTDQIFSNHEIQYFIAVAGQFNQIIENDRLYRDYVTQKRYEKELDNASYVQLRLFPKVVPDRQRGLDINFYYRPYLRIIGDYFDFINIDDNRTAVIIGDVSGHGLSASMILSAINSITYSMLREGMSLDKTFAEINFFLNNSFKGVELFTMFIGIFDRASKVMEYINAGHVFPVLVRKETGEIEFIESRGKVLGADPDVKYFSSGITLGTGDELILYTDGIVEIINEATGERFDEKRFIKIIKDNLKANVDAKINAVEKDIDYFNEAIKDDITIIGIEIR